MTSNGFDIPTFRGSAEWVHALEGHAGHPYWPGGASGITLDPGVDLGYVRDEIFHRAYGDVLSARESTRCMNVMGVRGEHAYRLLEDDPVFTAIEITPATAERIFPVVAAPYWQSITDRVPALLEGDVPPAVQTVALSLSYNRGPHNEALEPLDTIVRQDDWTGMADYVASMRDDHDLTGLEKRRAKESSHIRTSVREGKWKTLGRTAEEIEAAPMEELKTSTISDLVAQARPAAS